MPSTSSILAVTPVNWPVKAAGKLRGGSPHNADSPLDLKGDTASETSGTQGEASSEAFKDLGRSQSAHQLEDASKHTMSAGAFELKRDWLVSSFSLRRITGSQTGNSQQSRDRELMRTLSFNDAAAAHRTSQSSAHEACSRMVIHPNSPARLTWDFLALGLIFFDLVLIPLQVFDLPESDPIAVMNWVTLTFWTCEIPLMLVTGFHANGHVVMQPARIMARYAMTWLPFDVMIVGTEWFFKATSDGNDAGGTSRLFRSFRFMRFMRTIKLLRLLKLRRIMMEIEDRINDEAISIYFNVLKIVLMLITLNHIIACGWYGIGLLYKNSNSPNWIEANYLGTDSIGYRYSTAMHWSLTQFTPASMEIRPHNTGERAYAIVILLFALVGFSSFVSSLTSSMTHLRHLRNNETRQFWLLRRYLKDATIPPNLAYRIHRYLDHAYQRHQQRVQASDVKILDMLSERLRAELDHEAYVDHLNQHPLMVQVGTRSRIFFHALSQDYLTDSDVVFAMEEKAKHLFFLPDTGLFDYSVNMAAANGEPTGGLTSEQLEGPCWLCEAALWTVWCHVGDLVATSESHVVRMDEHMLTRELVQSKHRSVAMRYAQKFIARLNEVGHQDLSDLTDRMFDVGSIVDLTSGRGSVVERVSPAVPWQMSADKRRRFLELPWGTWFQRPIQ